MRNKQEQTTIFVCGVFFGVLVALVVATGVLVLKATMQ